MIEEYLEDITKEWLMDLLVVVYPIDILDINNPEATQDTPRPSKTKKTKNLEEI
jgi:hypothetical protein